MDYKISIANEKIWDKDCNRIPREDLLRIYRRVQSLSEYPWVEGMNIKKLHEYDVADFRLRVGDYRVLFNKYDDRQEIRLYRVLHRSKLY